MPFYRTAMEVERLKNKIENYIHKYFPSVRIMYGKIHPRPFRAGEAFAWTVGPEKKLWINETILVSWPEEDIWGTINHELAHLFMMPEYREKYPSYPLMFPKEMHDESWEQLTRILGGEVEEPDEVEYPKRFKVRCAKCGITFYTNGVWYIGGKYYGEPKRHSVKHDKFYVEDIITRKRALLPRIPSMIKALYGG